jgi:hypothetical protein
MGVWEEKLPGAATPKASPTVKRARSENFMIELRIFSYMGSVDTDGK